MRPNPAHPPYTSGGVVDALVSVASPITETWSWVSLSPAATIVIAYLPPGFIAFWSRRLTSFKVRFSSCPVMRGATYSSSWPAPCVAYQTWPRTRCHSARVDPPVFPERSPATRRCALDVPRGPFQPTKRPIVESTLIASWSE